MGTANGYVWVLPALIVAVWILSWRRRWVLLPVAFVVSVLCFAYGVHSYGVTPAAVQESLPKGDTFSSKDLQCSPFFACLDRYPVYWLMAGVTGFVSCVILTLITGVVDVIGFIARRDPMPDD